MVPDAFSYAVRTLLGLRFISQPWRIPCFLMLGIFAGFGLFVVHISRATSYLGDDPATCVNCHVMTTQYVTWQHSSHANVATCNDCHVPHDNIAHHYAFKAQDGLWHSTVFTMRWEPQAIRMSERAKPVVENNCRRCHWSVIEDTSLAAHQNDDLLCWDCHREVPHGRVRSLSATPRVFQPQLPWVGDPRQRQTLGDRPIMDRERLLPNTEP
jgi:cytochrome c nitrite reductase small subunit